MKILSTPATMAAATLLRNGFHTRYSTLPSVSVSTAIRFSPYTELPGSMLRVASASESLPPFVMYTHSCRLLSCCTFATPRLPPPPPLESPRPPGAPRPRPPGAPRPRPPPPRPPPRPRSEGPPPRPPPRPPDKRGERRETGRHERRSKRDSEE